MSQNRASGLCHAFSRRDAEFVNNFTTDQVSHSFQKVLFLLARRSLLFSRSVGGVGIAMAPLARREAAVEGRVRMAPPFPLSCVKAA
jgi:hypothetical protein